MIEFSLRRVRTESIYLIVKLQQTNEKKIATKSIDVF